MNINFKHFGSGFRLFIFCSFTMCFTTLSTCSYLSRLDIILSLEFLTSTTLRSRKQTPEWGVIRNSKKICFTVQALFRIKRVCRLKVRYRPLRTKVCNTSKQAIGAGIKVTAWSSIRANKGEARASDMQAQRGGSFSTCLFCYKVTTVNRVWRYNCCVCRRNRRLH